MRRLRVRGVGRRRLLRGSLVEEAGVGDRERCEDVATDGLAEG